MQAATEQQIALLQHTLGLRVEQRTPYRNYFVAGPGHHDMPDLEVLESLGLMGRARTPAFCDQSDIVFCTTDAGRALALEKLPEPPKPTKYSEWIDHDCRTSFGEFLCGNRLPVFEFRGDSWSKTREYRMYRLERSAFYNERDVQGMCASTKKEAKASYKAALKAHQDAQRAAAHKEST
jgi:hypothetical protein